MGEADTNGDQHIDFGEFLTVVERTKAGDSSVKGLGDAIRKKSSVMLQIKKDATVHSFAEEVRMALEPLTLSLTTDPDANPDPDPNPNPNPDPNPNPNPNPGVHGLR